MNEISEAKKVVIELNTLEPLPPSLTKEELQLSKEGCYREAADKMKSRALKLLTKRLKNGFFLTFHPIVEEEEEFADPLLAIILGEYGSRTRYSWEKAISESYLLYKS